MRRTVWRREIAGRIIDIARFGTIGRSMCRHRFRVNMIASSAHTPASDMMAAGVHHCETQEIFLAKSDAFSPHSVLNGSTRYLIGGGRPRQDFAKNQHRAVPITCRAHRLLKTGGG
jgi:phosphoglycerate dehydrogenase-like enzyme